MTDMKLSVVVRGLDHSDAAVARLRGEMDKLAHLVDRPLSGTAPVESPDSPRGCPQLSHTHLRILDDGTGNAIVSQVAADHHDEHKAVGDRFGVTRRHLLDKVERMRELGRQQDALVALSDIT